MISDFFVYPLPLKAMVWHPLFSDAYKLEILILKQIDAYRHIWPNKAYSDVFYQLRKTGE